jgi:membrane protein
MILKGLWQVIKEGASEFGRHDGIKLSASLSFFTVLTIGPMMLVIIWISSMFWGRKAIEGTIHSQISGVVGDRTAMQIQELIKNASIESNSFVAVIGFIALAIAATTFFTQVQTSMNTIWNLRIKKSNNWQQMLKKRLLSLSILAGLGILVLGFLVIDGFIEGFMKEIREMFPQYAVTIIYIGNLLLTIVLVALMFAFIFKVLPDAVIKWKDVAPGALFTAVLFMIGKFGVTFYINISNIRGAFGSAGSIIVLLVWIFVSAIILFFGAEVTKAYALKYGDEVIPKDYAFIVKVIPE